jgi:hypothetical protein
MHLCRPRPGLAWATRDAVLHYYAFAGSVARIALETVAVGVTALQETITRFQQIGTDELLLFTGTPEVEQLQRLADLIGRLSLV